MCAVLVFEEFAFGCSCLDFPQRHHGNCGSVSKTIVKEKRQENVKRESETQRQML